MQRSIKEVVRGYMQGCKAEARKLGFEGNLYDSPPYYRVLTHKGQLQAMINYVYANPERSWQRKQNPDLFRMHRNRGLRPLFTSLGQSFPPKPLTCLTREVFQIRPTPKKTKPKDPAEQSWPHPYNRPPFERAPIPKGEPSSGTTLPLPTLLPFLLHQWANYMYFVLQS